MPAPVRRAALGVVVALTSLAGIPAAQATTAPAPTPTEPTAKVQALVPATDPVGTGPAGLPLPHAARRTFTNEAAATLFPRPPCERAVYSYYERGPVLLADFGGGEYIDPVDAVRALRAAGFGWDVMETALSVLGSESDRCPRTIHNNISSTGVITSTDYGLWQINTKWHPKYAKWNLFDPVVNSRAAKEIYDTAGWSAWHGYPNRGIYASWAYWAVVLAKREGVR